MNRRSAVNFASAILIANNYKVAQWLGHLYRVVALSCSICLFLIMAFITGMILYNRLINAGEMSCYVCSKKKQQERNNHGDWRREAVTSSWILTIDRQKYSQSRSQQARSRGRTTKMSTIRKKRRIQGWHMYMEVGQNLIAYVGAKVVFVQYKYIHTGKQAAEFSGVAERYLST